MFLSAAGFPRLHESFRDQGPIIGCAIEQFAIALFALERGVPAVPVDQRFNRRADQIDNDGRRQRI